MKRFPHDFIYLNRGERTALLLAAVLLLGILGIRIWLTGRPVPLPEDAGELASELAQWRNANEKAQATVQNTEERNKTAESPILKPEPFDPNSVREDQLLAMGLPEKVISNILSYRNAGGKFYKPDDLGRIYGMSKDLFRQLKPFIIIQETEEAETQPEESSAKIIIQTELNAAGEEELMALPGIGKVYAGRIIAYRDKLGGFRFPSQLLEVYGMDSIRYNGIKDLLVADTLLLRKLDLNRAGYQELVSHPYLTSRDANAILSYRKFAGKIGSSTEINENQLLADSTWKKVAAYLVAGTEN